MWAALGIDDRYVIGVIPDAVRYDDLHSLIMGLSVGLGFHPETVNDTVINTAEVIKDEDSNGENRTADR